MHFLIFAQKKYYTKSLIIFFNYSQYKPESDLIPVNLWPSLINNLVLVTLSYKVQLPLVEKNSKAVEFMNNVY